VVCEYCSFEYDYTVELFAAKHCIEHVVVMSFNMPCSAGTVQLASKCTNFCTLCVHIHQPIFTRTVCGKRKRYRVCPSVRLSVPEAACTAAAKCAVTAEPCSGGRCAPSAVRRPRKFWPDCKEVPCDILVIRATLC